MPPSPESGQTSRREYLLDLAVGALCLILAIALAAHAYVGLFSRYMADDYCTAATVRTASLLQTQRHLYLGWSGRFSFTLTVSIIELFGTRIVPFLPLAALLCWLSALTWATYQFLSPTFRRKSLLFSFFLAELIIFVTVADNKSGVYEALYWQTGMLSFHLASHTRGGVGASNQGRLNQGWRLAFIAASGFLLMCCCLLPASYALSAMPPARALITPQFLLICTLASLGWTAGIASGRRFASLQLPRRFPLDFLFAALALLLTLPVIDSARQTFSKAEKARTLARLWDRQDAEIRARLARGERELTVPVVYNIGGTDLLKRDPEWYVNHCVAAFYGADSITAVPDDEGFRILSDESAP
ncbi:MAG: hypothetical protein QOH51_2799 [Acidobacteriota bacterium]|nr:hypothetical protein [Acidobacteriota bacterium]